MKLILPVIISIYLTIFSVTCYASDLPFIGERWFNFYGGNKTEGSINIESNGHTVVKFYGINGVVTEYDGDYINPIAVEGYEIEYYLYSDKLIFLLEDGKLSYDCNPVRFGDNSPCMDDLIAVE